VPFLTVMSESPQSYHLPVLLSEVSNYLITNPEGIYLDGTLGGGGHAEYIINKIKDSAQYIGIDQDKEAIEYSKARLKKFSNFFSFHYNFSELDLVLTQLKLNVIDGILLDLGVSSYQIDNENRGFSYMKDADLDMRMDRDSGQTAAELLNLADEKELSSIFFYYGEERKSRKIAREIVRYRKKESIQRSDQLKSIISRVVDPRFKIKSYARIFQALRIAINKELEKLEETLEKSLPYLKQGGRILVISYHSLEDRIVKNFFRKKANPCTCPSELPQCVCGLKPEIKILTPKVVKASKKEINENPRARSALLRVGEKI
jgi:16S rRNA (cytosine1402-N4)-methyltransferase